MISATIVGNLGKDAELVSGDTPRLKFNVASNTRGRDGNTKTTWVNCTGFGTRFVGISSHLRKGTSVAARGRLDLVEGRDGSFLSLTVDEVEFAGARQQQREERRATEYSDDDIPI